jgi:hypothetical protein
MVQCKFSFVSNRSKVIQLFLSSYSVWLGFALWGTVWGIVIFKVAAATKFYPASFWHYVHCCLLHICWDTRSMFHLDKPLSAPNPQIGFFLISPRMRYLMGEPPKDTFLGQIAVIGMHYHAGVGRQASTVRECKKQLQRNNSQFKPSPIRRHTTFGRS